MSRTLPQLLETRSAGILLHVTSLPSRFGIGDFGPAAFEWVRSLERAKQTWWQMLPLTPPGEGNSPYGSLSAFAGNANLISPELLMRDGLLSGDDLAVHFPEEQIDYPRVLRFKAVLLRKAWERFKQGAAKGLHAEFERFRADEAWWLQDVAIFNALHEMYRGKDWSQWPRELVLRKTDALGEIQRERDDTIRRHQFVQFLFFRQLHWLRNFAAERGVHLIGDLPIFVSYHSADVWANPHLFLLDKNRRPTCVAGVPPDHFCKTGQRWGNPLYNWRAMQKAGYGWWIRRFTAALRQASVVRIDHFRGFAAFWQIPSSERTAERGKWVNAPGLELFKAVAAHLNGLPFIAEDLGLITPDVIALRQALALPGMRILQFAFGSGPGNPHLPHNYEPNAVAYTGTHDNDTSAGWFAALPKLVQADVRRYFGLKRNPPGADVCQAMIRSAWSSVANCAIVPMQDLLALPSTARMNTPGRNKGNWRWQLTARQLKPEHFDRLAELTELFGRSSHHADS